VLNNLKKKLETMQRNLGRVPNLALIGATRAVIAMKRRIFVDGLRTDMQQIGRYRGRRQGRAVTLVDTGELKNSIRAIQTSKGAAIVAPRQGAKIKSIQDKYGTVFKLTNQERRLLFSSLKK
jgi:hypothetical protein